jgi:hypothetical protein
VKRGAHARRTELTLYFERQHRRELVRCRSRQQPHDNAGRKPNEHARPLHEPSVDSVGSASRGSHPHQVQSARTPKKAVSLSRRDRPCHHQDLGSVQKVMLNTTRRPPARIGATLCESARPRTQPRCSAPSSRQSPARRLAHEVGRGSGRQQRALRLSS